MLGASNACAVLARVGRPDVPVACGSPQPLHGNAAFPATWRDQADSLYGLTAAWPAPSDGEPAGQDAVRLISALASAHPGLQILALGPLTTIARAVHDPGVRASHPRIVVSGGAVHEPGNMPAAGLPLPVAEWNIGVDPEAAQAVLDSGVRATWVPLDAANQAPIDIWFAQALTAETRGASGDAALELLRGFGRPGSTDRGPQVRPGQPAFVVTQELAGYRFQAPGPVRPGRTTFGFDATTGPGFAAVIAQLAPGHTPADVERFLARDRTAPPAWATVRAQADVPAGSNPTWVVDLPAGTFVVVAAQRDGASPAVVGAFRT